MRKENLPAMPLAEWEETRLRFQLICQMMGKVRLKLHPPLNHWWHAPLYVSARGLTTAAMPYPGGQLDMELDLIDHQLSIRTDQGEHTQIPISKSPICHIYDSLMDALEDVGATVEILAKPYKCKSDVPFPQDDIHNAYDPRMMSQAWRILAEVEPVLKRFRGRFLGKCSPVHMFWHSLDLAVTRFSGRAAPAHPEWDPVNREAYSHEVCSAGFWFGDDQTPNPMFYSYSYPAPERIADQPLSTRAFWGELNGSPYALLPYEEVRKMADPEQGLLDFLQSSYEAGAQLGKWDRELLER